MNRSIIAAVSLLSIVSAPAFAATQPVAPAKPVQTVIAPAKPASTQTLASHGAKHRIVRHTTTLRAPVKPAKSAG